MLRKASHMCELVLKPVRESWMVLEIEVYKWLREHVALGIMFRPRKFADGGKRHGVVFADPGRCAHVPLRRPQRNARDIGSQPILPFAMGD